MHPIRNHFSLRRAFHDKLKYSGNFKKMEALYVPKQAIIIKSLRNWWMGGMTALVLCEYIISGRRKMRFLFPLSSPG